MQLIVYSLFAMSVKLGAVKLSEGFGLIKRSGRYTEQGATWWRRGMDNSDIFKFVCMLENGKFGALLDLMWLYSSLRATLFPWLNGHSLRLDMETMRTVFLFLSLASSVHTQLPRTDFKNTLSKDSSRIKRCYCWDANFPAGWVSIFIPAIIWSQLKWMYPDV